MPNPIDSILNLATLFSFLLAFSFILNAIYTLKHGLPLKKDSPCEQNDTPAKNTRAAHSATSEPKRRKKLKIVFKDRIVKNNPFD